MPKIFVKKLQFFNFILNMILSLSHSVFKLHYFSAGMRAPGCGGDWPSLLHVSQRTVLDLPLLPSGSVGIIKVAQPLSKPLFSWKTRVLVDCWSAQHPISTARPPPQESRKSDNGHGVQERSVEKQGETETTGHRRILLLVTDSLWKNLNNLDKLRVQSAVFLHTNPADIVTVTCLVFVTFMFPRCCDIKFQRYHR